jgi:hypothetical protein
MDHCYLFQKFTVDLLFLISEVYSETFAPYFSGSVCSLFQRFAVQLLLPIQRFTVQLLFPFSEVYNAIFAPYFRHL